MHFCLLAYVCAACPETYISLSWFISAVNYIGKAETFHSQPAGTLANTEARLSTIGQTFR